MKKSSSSNKKFYFVKMSIFCIRKGRNGCPNTVMIEKDAYSNVFDSYDVALDYAHHIMMINHGSKCQDFDEFKETINILDHESDISRGMSGYVHHVMKNGIERFDGFDTMGSYPLLFDEITITEKKIYGSYDDYGNESIPQALQTVDMAVISNTVDEFTPQQHESNQEAIDRIADSIGGIESLCQDSTYDCTGDEFDRMLGILKAIERRHQ